MGESVAGVTAHAQAPIGGLEVRSPEPGEKVKLGDRLVLRFRCVDTGVGVESCGGTLKDGARLDTSTRGAHTTAVRAWDRNGNTTTRIVSWNVLPKKPGPVHPCGKSPFWWWAFACGR